MNDLLKRMLNIQDQLLDHLNNPAPSPKDVLATFEQAYASMQETADDLALHTRQSTQPSEDLKQSVILAAHFANMMKRVKEHLDSSRTMQV